MDTLTLAAAFAALHRHGIHTLDGLDVDLTNGADLRLVAHTPAAAHAVLRCLDDLRKAHGHTPFQVGRWHGVLPIAGTDGVVVRLVQIDTSRRAA